MGCHTNIACLVLSFPGSEQLFHIASGCSHSVPLVVTEPVLKKQMYSWNHSFEEHRQQQNQGGLLEGPPNTVLEAQLQYFENRGTGSHPNHHLVATTIRGFPVPSPFDTMKKGRWQQWLFNSIITGHIAPSTGYHHIPLQTS